MSIRRIAVIAGDGIGPEVVEQAIQVTDAALAVTGETKFHWEHFPWNSGYYLEHGTMMPTDGLDLLREFDAIFLGAIGHPDVQDHVTLNGLLLPIRRVLDLYVNLRPSYLYEGVTSPLRDQTAGSIDLVVFRENTEGEYSNVGGRVHELSDHEVAIQTSVFTRRGTERIIRAAFQKALTRRKHVTSVTKSNAQGYSGVLWDEVFERVADDFPGVQTRSLLVDAAAMEFVRRPETLDVVVASNLFGDILTDLAAIVTGSIGLAASANINPVGTTPSMFEPVHGSAPDIVGQGIANPLAAVLAIVMMLEHLEHTRTAELIHSAVRKVLRQSRVLPPDLGGTASTKEVTQAVQAAFADSVDRRR